MILKILFARNLFSPADLGGNRYAVEVTKRLADRGYELTVVTSGNRRCLQAAFPWARFFTYPKSTHGTAVNHLIHVLGSFLNIRFVLSRLRPDLVVVASYEVAWTVLRSRLAKAVPVVFIYHAQLYSDFVERFTSAGPRAGLVGALPRAYSHAIERYVLEHATVLVPVSGFSGAQIRERVGTRAARIVPIPNGVDTSLFLPCEDRRVAKTRLGHDPDTFLLLGVGRLSEVKRFGVLLRVAAALLADGLNISLILLGDGPERGRLQSLANTLNISHRVRFLGFQDEVTVRRYMQAADLQICSSKFENRSLAIMEAMSCGTPVVGTPTGGTPELLSQVDSGLIAGDLSVDALARAVRWVLSDAGLANSLREKCRSVAVQQFDWSRTVDGLDRLFKSLAAA